MISDYERHEVAERLKGYVSEWRDMPSFSVQKGVACSLGIVRFDVESQLLRLADLIEPGCDRDVERTCRVESSHEEEGDGCYSYFKYELTCGHEMAWGDQLPPSYCPECGRRVLYDSDDYI